MQSLQTWLWRPILRWTKLPVVPLYGFFPVRLTTYIGDPIHPRDFESASQMREAVVAAMEVLIDKHQVNYNIFF